MLGAFEVDTTLVDSRAGEYAFAEGILGDYIQFFVGADGEGSAVSWRVHAILVSFRLRMGNANRADRSMGAVWRGVYSSFNPRREG